MKNVPRTVERLRTTAAFVALLGICASCSHAQNEQVFFGNLHSHTSYSDGVGTPDEAYQHARFVAGLDFLAITEHNHAQAAGSDGISIATQKELYTGVMPNGAPFPDGLIPIANSMTSDGNFVALYGQEVSSISKGNHVNVFDAPAVVEIGDVPNGEFDDLINTWLPTHLDSAGQGAILQMNHPGNGPSSKEYGRDDFDSEADWISKLDAHAQLIAIINGPSHKSGGPLPPGSARESQYKKFLNLGFHIAPVADQDNHFRTWGTITNARTAVVAPQLTKAEILRALRSRHVYATEDRNLAIIFRIDGHLCGDRVPAPAVGTALDVEVTITDPDEPNATYEVDVFADTIGGSERAQVIDTYVLDGNTSPGEVWTIDDLVYEGGHQYFFFRVRQFEEDGDGDRAWTAPVWFEPAGTTPQGTVIVDTEGIAHTDLSGFVASRRSEVFHVGLFCQDAARIKESNRINGAESLQGRRIHTGCPRR